jgi:hypothetical protein
MPRCGCSRLSVGPHNRATYFGLLVPTQGLALSYTWKSRNENEVMMHDGYIWGYQRGSFSSAMWGTALTTRFSSLSIQVDLGQGFG